MEEIVHREDLVLLDPKKNTGGSVEDGGDREDGDRGIAEEGENRDGRIA